MKKSTIYTIIILLILFFSEFSYLFEDLNLNPFDYARITDVDYKAVLVDEPRSNGKVIITERLTFDIHAASKDNLFWELWRDLPESYIDGAKVDYKVNSVKQILKDGTEVIYKESPDLYWEDEDYTSTYLGYGPGKWYHSEGPYNEYARQYECVFFYVDGLYREEVVFEIEYEMYNAALRYNDCSELYLSMYSEETIKHLNSFNGQILIPNEDMPSDGNYEAYTYGTNYNSFDFEESKSINPGYHTFSFNLDKSDLKFRPYNQYIEFSLISYGTDKHKFTEHAYTNYYYNDDVLEEIRSEQKEYENTPIEYSKYKILVFLSTLVISYLILKHYHNKIKKTKENHIFYNPTMQMDYFREIPSDLDPNFASALAFCKHKDSEDVKDGYAATILSLARKGYIELRKMVKENSWTFHNVKIVIKYNPNPEKTNPVTPEIQNILSKLDITTAQNIISELKATHAEQVAEASSKFEVNPNIEPLSPTEEEYFNLIVRHSIGNEISMSSFQSKIASDYQNTNSFALKIKGLISSIGVSQGYFQRINYKQPKKELKSTAKSFGILGTLILTVGNFISYQTYLDLAFGSFFILGILLIICAFYLNKASKKAILLTQFGEDEYIKWRGLYNFLNSETLMNERTLVELPIWEQYLVYATAFGISEKVIKALEIRCPEMIETSSILSNPYYRSRSFYSGTRSFRTATRSASSTARYGGYSSGFGGHGGYGGGGRGGGGGGGGH